MKPEEFLPKAFAAAKAAGHVWPEYASCEAALESGWGESLLCKQANNLFGQKQGFSTEGLPTVEIMTHEYFKGRLVVVPAEWPSFPSWESSFAARMELLKRSSLYAYALGAESGEDFIRRVSKVWSTDPDRGSKVLQIHDAHHDIFTDTSQ